MPCDVVQRASPLVFDTDLLMEPHEPCIKLHTPLPHPETHNYRLSAAEGGMSPLNLTTYAKQMATSWSCSPKWLLVLAWQQEKSLFSLNSSHLHTDINTMLSKLSHTQTPVAVYSSQPFSLLIYMQKLTGSKDL